ncbi:MAG: HD domain-containing protein [Clostridiaceae bacterium]|nr:HD domain-containing protein [Clostridiaceae bacterium]
MIPQYALEALNTLERKGYEAYFVGGCVRDMVRGREPCDWDISTNALPMQTIEAFSGFHIVETGLKHGTVTVFVDSMPVEITTYRSEGAYVGNRRPENVRFICCLDEDLKRRDFTMNAMAYNPALGIKDPLRGMDDIKSGVIRAVGNPAERFEEDALRILRGMRFSSCLGYEIELLTFTAMAEKAPLLNNISKERVFSEIKKMALGDHIFKALSKCAEILREVIPEIDSTIGFNQKNRHHIYDVWEHTARAVAYSPPDLWVRLALIFHDVGKPNSFTIDKNGEGHFYGHAKLSAEMTRTALLRLKADKRTVEEVTWLVAFHDYQLKDDEKTVQRLISRFGSERARRLLQVKIADNMAQSPRYQIRGKEASRLLEMLDITEKGQNRLTLKDLAVKGEDLLAIGMRGQSVGEALESLLEDVIDGKCQNVREELLKRVKGR